MIILIGAAIAFMLIGFFGYNPLRKKFAGVIGVGGSYIILLGIMLLCAAIGQIIRTAGGDHSVSTLEIVGTGVIALLCLGYMVFVMIGRCETTAQRVALPFVACLCLLYTSPVGKRPGTGNGGFDPGVQRPFVDSVPPISDQLRGRQGVRERDLFPVLPPPSPV